jgi:NAD-dependent dihydropyrimidine dehydrogenase PreA subunit
MTTKPYNIHNISSLPKNKCYGCGVCVQTCPQDCIRMAPDLEGFLYPQVDEQKCIDCQRCITTCPGFSPADRDPPVITPTFIGGNINDEEIRFSSSSGGAFSLIANHVLSIKGAVYGAIYDFETLTVVHARASSQADLAPMRKSKYVQSDTTGIFPKVQKDLSAKTPVLFTGTPCQVDGLKLFLGEDHPNLITCDIICHGVPSPGLFTSHFSAIQSKHQQPIKNIDFRTKEKGWGSYLNFFYQIDFESKTILRHALTDAFYTLFLANLSLRPCCYTCKYADITRISDLTIGDFWSVKNEAPALFDGKGTSLILTNTQKGESVLNSLGNQATLKRGINLKSLPPNLRRPSDRPKFRDKIFHKISLDQWYQQRRKYQVIAILIIIQNKALAVLKRLGLILSSNHQT